MRYIFYRDKLTSEIRQVPSHEWHQMRFDGYRMKTDKDLVFLKEDEEPGEKKKKLK